MHRYSIWRNVRFLRMLAPAAAGTTVVYTNATPVTGRARLYGFAVGFGAIVSGGLQSVEVQGSSDGTNWYKLKDQDGDDVKATVADTDDNKVVLIEVVQPTANVKYLRLAINRATQNATIEFMLGLVDYNKDEPITQDSTMVVAQPVSFVAPVFGSAA